MKRRLNILCLIVMLVLGYSVVHVGYYFFVGAKLGVEVVTENRDDVSKLHNVMNMQYVNLLPKSLSLGGKGNLFVDSVYNEKSATYVPATYSSLLVSVETRPSTWNKITDKILVFLQLILYIWAVVLFVRLIISINKSDIFNWRNVRRLRRIGIFLIIAFCCTLISAYLSMCNVEEVFSVRGYELSLSEVTDTTVLVLGICSLIVGEIFAIGLKMKEEQDLTI